jgi:hypothetical protein
MEVLGELMKEIFTIMSAYKNKASSIWLPSFFLIAIFFGDIWLKKLTLPLSMLTIPFFLLAFSPLKLFSLKNIPKGVYFLTGLLVILSMQIMLGESLKWRADLTTWTPIIFALATIISLREVKLSDENLGFSMYVGGGITAAIMLCMIMFVSPNFYLIPGQNILLVQKLYNDARLMEINSEMEAEWIENSNKKIPLLLRDDTGLFGYIKHAFRLIRVPVSLGYIKRSPSLTYDKRIFLRTALARKISAEKLAYYSKKNRVKNTLGNSNYIAVFFVFLFTVALFSGNFIVAGLMVACTAITMCRFGGIFILLSSAIYCLRQKYPASVLSATILAAALMGLMLVLIFRNFIVDLPIEPSLLQRLNFWLSGLSVAYYFPILGAPRSYILESFNLDITWSPHNALLFLATNFGILGIVAYVGYIIVALRTMNRAAQESKMWTGVFIGVSIVLAWSMVEIVVLTPAFEILFAALYILARNREGLANQIKCET